MMRDGANPLAEHRSIHSWCTGTVHTTIVITASFSKTVGIVIHEGHEGHEDRGPSGQSRLAWPLLHLVAHDSMPRPRLLTHSPYDCVCRRCRLLTRLNNGNTRSHKINDSGARTMREKGKLWDVCRRTMTFYEGNFTVSIHGWSLLGKRSLKPRSSSSFPSRVPFSAFWRPQSTKAAIASRRTSPVPSFIRVLGLSATLAA